LLSLSSSRLLLLPSLSLCASYYFSIFILLSRMLQYPMDIIVNRYLPILKSNIWLIYFLISLQYITSNFF
jgi:hypothetical protein